MAVFGFCFWFFLKMTSQCISDPEVLRQRRTQPKDKSQRRKLDNFGYAAMVRLGNLSTVASWSNTAEPVLQDSIQLFTCTYEKNVTLVRTLAEGLRHHLFRHIVKSYKNHTFAKWIPTTFMRTSQKQYWAR